MMHRLPELASALLFSCVIATAGPPFLTDDPEPVPWHHYEAYAFSTWNRSSGSTFLMIPAFEFNAGVAPDVQLHIILPGAYTTPPRAFGIGDIELGVKYRFLHETASRPQIGVFPMLEVPSGDSRRGLGNGTTWARLPVWLQKSNGSWTTYGGGGYQINHAPGMQDSVFAGWLVQREITKHLILGAELYYQGPQTAGDRRSALADMGGYYNLRENLSLLFMVGHTVAGERQMAGYFGLYYTWGSNRPAAGIRSSLH
ncbi:MAG: transporter [Bryobacterales bacterium]|nr:transporter [Bryobacterales bacterium]